MMAAAKADKMAEMKAFHLAVQRAVDSVGMMVSPLVDLKVANLADWTVVGSAD